MLEDRKIKRLIQDQNPVLIHVDEKDVQPISVDLNVDSIVCWEINENKLTNFGQGEQEIEEGDVSVRYHTSYALKPNETVFVKTREGLQMPDHLIGRVVEKNSIIRLGLLVSGPLYQPTHQTAIYLRVTNLSEYTIELHKGLSIAQITFEEVDPPEVPYAKKRDAHYNDEFSFKPPPHVLIQKSIKPEDQMKEQVKSVESKVLTVFTTFMGAFVSSLALIVVDFQSMSEELPSVKELVILNLSLAVSIAVILLCVFNFYLKLNNPQRKSMGIRDKIKNIDAGKKFLPFLIGKRRFKSGNSTGIYIAACYREHERNQKIYERMISEGLPAFLPENMHLVESDDMVEQSKIFRRCYAALDSCSIVVVIYPFGKSVSAEIGYAFAKNKIVIELQPPNVIDHTECMIDPGFHFVVDSEKELIDLLKKLLPDH